MSTPQRYDLYGPIHKALRAWSTDILVKLGRADWQHEDNTRKTLTHLRDHLAVHWLHIAHEDRFIHPVLARLVPGSEAAAVAEHDRHAEALRQLEAAAEALSLARPDAREGLGYALYLQFAQFLAIDFEHMHDEETRHMQILWAHLSDAEIAAIEHQIVASQSPQEAMQVLQWMLPNLTAAQRAEKFAGLRAAAPPPVVAAVTDLLTARLTEFEMKRLWENIAA